MNAEQARTRHEALTTALRALHPVWAPRPFIQRRLPWEAAHPALSAWLRGLDEPAVEALEADVFSGTDAAPEPFGAMARACLELSRIDALSADDAPLPGAREGVPGRKRAQVERFAAVARGRLNGVTGLLDWCSGKGHLGRSLALCTGLPLRILEQDAALAGEGEARARQEGVVCSACVADALAPSSWALLREGEAAVALHACGALTDTLLRESDRRGLGAVVVAPCCYHRYHTDEIGAMSAPGAAAGLVMPRDLGRLVTAEEVVARPRLRRLRRQEMAWRLGLDAALRVASGADRYTTLPPVTSTVAQLPFDAFCRYFQERHGLALPTPWDPDRFEEAGRTLARHARALSMVRCLFRRPLELWIVLDRVLFLAERGWSVEVGTFCEASLTPRNLVIAARR